MKSTPRGYSPSNPDHARGKGIQVWEAGSGEQGVKGW
jgi:hypothetical protein